MTEVLSPPAVPGLAAARDVVEAATGEPLWSLTDRELAAQFGQALALRAQDDAVLLARLGEADARGLARSRGATSTVAWLRGSHRLAPGEASGWSAPPGRCANNSPPPRRRWPRVRSTSARSR